MRYEAKRRLGSLGSLERLRAMQRGLSAAQHAARAKELQAADSARIAAEERYRSALEMLRRHRFSGTAIDPLRYGYEVESADAIQKALADSVEASRLAKTVRDEAMSDFVGRHAQHKVATQALEDARSDVAREQAIEESIEMMDQYNRHMTARGGA